MERERKHFQRICRYLGVLEVVAIFQVISRPKEEGLTIGVNYKQEEPPGRFDRILVRGEHLEPKSIEVLGTQRIPHLKDVVFPSDHLGLVAFLDIK